MLAHETGHRIGAIRNLLWSDIDLEGAMVLWRAKHEKTGYEHITPLTDEAVAVLEEARRMNPEGGDGPVLPAPANPSECLGAWRALKWWYRAATLAGLEPKRGRGWHSLRRKFASDLMDQPLKVLCELGGWKNPQTVLTCYQQANTGRLRNGFGKPREGSRPVGSQSAGVNRRESNR
ncbi:MAG: tyrosine-type recombinase/integrase [Gammaproteobacteria bacterium]|nr:tyrosine-type recombinase/integrase [Gammaproteobacteria bacterium]